MSAVTGRALPRASAPRWGQALSVTVYEDRDALERVREALSRRLDCRKVGIDPDHVEF